MQAERLRDKRMTMKEAVRKYVHGKDGLSIALGVS
jgi:hypothetical protein